MRLKDKVAVVTGSASGIGKAIALRFAQEGALVVIADKNESLIPATVAEIAAAGGNAAGVAMDVTQREQLHEIMNDIAAKHGRIDILINNAGITRYRPFATTSGEDWDLILDVDLKGVFFCSQAAAPHMIRQHGGRIVNIASALGTGTSPYKNGGSPGASAPYVSAKAGVIMLTKTLARELGPHGVTVNCVAPGTFVTPLSASTRTPEELAAHLENRKKTTVLGRVAMLDELAAPVLFLASDEASYVTGQTLLVDGGRIDRM